MVRYKWKIYQSQKRSKLCVIWTAISYRSYDPRLCIANSINFKYWSSKTIPNYSTFWGAEPDLGRKGFQPELKVLSEKISTMIVSLGLSDWKRLLSADGKYNRRDNDAKQLHDYIREIENQYFNEISNPLGVEPETIIELGIQTAPPVFLNINLVLMHLYRILTMRISIQRI